MARERFTMRPLTALNVTASGRPTCPDVDETLTIFPPLPCLTNCCATYFPTKRGRYPKFPPCDHRYRGAGSYVKSETPCDRLCMYVISGGRVGVEAVWVASHAKTNRFWDRRARQCICADNSTLTEHRLSRASNRAQRSPHRACSKVWEQLAGASAVREKDQARTLKCSSSALSFSMMPVYSSSAMGSMAAPKNP